MLGFPYPLHPHWILHIPWIPTVCPGSSPYPGYGNLIRIYSIQWQYKAYKDLSFLLCIFERFEAYQIANQKSNDAIL